jgi:hypothetical protein
MNNTNPQDLSPEDRKLILDYIEEKYGQTPSFHQQFDTADEKISYILGSRNLDDIRKDMSSAQEPAPAGKTQSGGGLQPVTQAAAERWRLQ